MKNKYYIKFGVEGFNSFLVAELDYSKANKQVKIIGNYDEFNTDKSHKEDFEYNIETLTEEEDLINHDFSRTEMFDQVLSVNDRVIEDINLTDIQTLIHNYFELSQLDINNQYENNLMDMILFSVEGSDTEMIVKVDYTKPSHQNKDMTFEVVSYYNSLRHEYSEGFQKHKKEGLEKGVLKEYKFNLAEAMIPHLYRIGKDVEKLEPHDLFNLVEQKYQKENLFKSVEVANPPLSKKAENMGKLKEAYKIAEKEGTVRTAIAHSDGSKSPEYCYFHTCHSPFSQWHPSKYEYRDTKFSSAEQFMMYSKAKLFGDEEVAFKIMDMNNHSTILKSFMLGEITTKDILSSKLLTNKWKQAQQQIKDLGKEVSGFSEEIWAAKRIPIISVSNREKFNQNLGMKDTLMRTKEAIMVEASPWDKIYGVGLGKNDPLIKDPKNWKGLNLLGNVLTNLKIKFSLDLELEQEVKKKKKMKPM